jgi:WXG100 family type VII secretion target
VSEVRVDFGSLSAGSEQIMATYRQLQSTLETLEAELTPMVTSWDGEAREAYFAQKAKWEQASAAMAQILMQMGRAVSDAHANYSAAEKSNTSMWA